jgi:hypothetical protein
MLRKCLQGPKATHPTALVTDASGTKVRLIDEK